MLLTYPNDPNDLLLSGELVGGENLAGNAVLVDSPLGKGHVVLFANRPFWRNEPHGNYFLWFNAMLNWDHLERGEISNSSYDRYDRYVRYDGSEERAIAGQLSFHERSWPPPVRSRDLSYRSVLVVPVVRHPTITLSLASNY